MWFKQDWCSPEWGAMAPFHFVNEEVLPIAPEALFDLLVGAESWPEWFPDIVEVKFVTPEPHGVGSKRDVRLKLQRLQEEFTVFERGKRWTFFVNGSNVPLVSHFMEDYRLQPEGKGTRLKWSVHYRPRLPFRVLHPVLRPVFGKMFRDGMANLRKYVEASDG